MHDSIFKLNSIKLFWNKYISELNLNVLSWGQSIKEKRGYERSNRAEVIPCGLHLTIRKQNHGYGPQVGFPGEPPSLEGQITASGPEKFLPLYEE